ATAHGRKTGVTDHTRSELLDSQPVVSPQTAPFCNWARTTPVDPFPGARSSWKITYSVLSGRSNEGRISAVAVHSAGCRITGRRSTTCCSHGTSSNVNDHVAVRSTTSHSPTSPG